MAALCHQGRFPPGTKAGLWITITAKVIHKLRCDAQVSDKPGERPC